MIVKTFIISIYILATISKVYTRKAFPDKTNDDFQRDCINFHKLTRERHGSPALKLNAELIKYAKDRLINITQEDGLKHQHKGLREDTGENIYRAVGNAKVQSCHHAVQNWYSEMKFYDFAKGNFVPKAGHFTQLLWKGTADVGCARSMAANQKNKEKLEIYVACEYRQPGNIDFEFKDNVKAAPKGAAPFDFEKEYKNFESQKGKASEPKSRKSEKDTKNKNKENKKPIVKKAPSKKAPAKKHRR